MPVGSWTYSFSLMQLQIADHFTSLTDTFLPHRSLCYFPKPSTIASVNFYGLNIFQEIYNHSIFVRTLPQSISNGRRAKFKFKFFHTTLQCIKV